MQRAIIGDWVAWNPEIAPQAIEMNMMGKMGKPSGWGLGMPSHNSGKSGRWTYNITMIPTAINSKAAPNTG